MPPNDVATGKLDGPLSGSPPSDGSEDTVCLKKGGGRGEGEGQTSVESVPMPACAQRHGLFHRLAHTCRTNWYRSERQQEWPCNERHRTDKKDGGRGRGGGSRGRGMSSRVRTPTCSRYSHRVPHEQPRGTGKTKAVINEQLSCCGRACATMPARTLPSRGGEDRARTNVGWAAPKNYARNEGERREEQGGGAEHRPPMALRDRPPRHA